MPSEPFTIEELTGPGRRITLTSKSLPNRPVEFGGTQRVSKKWYQGLTVASAQVFGPTEEDTEVGSFWHTFQLVRDAETSLEGFDGVTGIRSTIVFGPTAQQLVEAFDAIRRAGQLLRVSWAAIIRHGFLQKASFAHHRREDIEFKLTFTWVSQGEPTPKTVLGPQADAPKRRDNVLSFMARARAARDELVRIGAMPGRLSLAIRTRVSAAVDVLDAAAAVLAAALSNTTGIARIPSATFFRVASLAQDCAVKARVLAGVLRTGNPDFDIEQDDETARVTGRIGLANMRRATLDVEAEVLRVAELFRRLATPDARRVIVAHADEDLREVSRRFYGNPDLWQRIADRNGLIGSRLRGGEVIVIPERA